MRERNAEFHSKQHRRQFKRRAQRVDAVGSFNLLTGPELLEVTDAHLPKHRERLYPPTVTLSMFMRQALDADGSCQKAVNSWAAQRSAEGLSVQSVRTGGYCKARERLPVSMVTGLTHAVGALISARAEAGWRWRGRHVKLVDGTGISINSISREGYTRQTAVGVSMGLNHMNGRLEDSITGRFISPDPYVPDPTNTQSFNRYSYVNNNPLALIDPSGFDELDPIVVIGTPIVEEAGDLFGVGGLFGGGGGGGLSVQQQKLQAAGLLNARNLQSLPSAAQAADSAFTYALNSGSAVQGPQITGASAPDFGMSFDPDYQSLDISAPTAASTLQEFAAQTAVDIQSDQALRNQSSNFNFDSPSYWSIVGQSFARSGSKAASLAAIGAVFLPIIGEFDEPLAVDAVETLMRSANTPINETGLSRAAQSLSSHANRAGGTFARPTGEIPAQNANAERLLRKMLTSPNVSAE